MQPADPLELGDLLGHPLLERAVPLASRMLGLEPRACSCTVSCSALMRSIDLHPRDQRRLVDRLGQVLVGAGLEAGDDVLGIGLGGDQDDRHERQRRVGLEPTADLDAVQLGHHDVEQDQVRTARARAAASASSPSAAVQIS